MVPTSPQAHLLPLLKLLQAPVNSEAGHDEDDAGSSPEYMWWEALSTMVGESSVTDWIRLSRSHYGWSNTAPLSIIMTCNTSLYAYNDVCTGNITNTSPSTVCSNFLIQWNPS